MKRKRPPNSIEIVLGDDQMKCEKCLHVRQNEPYAKKYYGYTHTKFRYEFTCWRCCRDIESTEMIRSKWPLAFERIAMTYGWVLDWSPGVRELVANHAKV